MSVIQEMIGSKEDLAVLEAILAERRKKDGLSFYIPNPVSYTHLTLPTNREV